MRDDTRCARLALLESEGILIVFQTQGFARGLASPWAGILRAFGPSKGEFFKFKVQSFKLGMADFWAFELFRGHLFAPENDLQKRSALLV